MKISRNRKGLIILPLCVLFLFLGVITVQATTYYVATSGNDSYPGTMAQPFRSIARGLSSLKLGDTLYIRAGTYGESINSNAQTIPTGTSWTDAPLISAYPGETVTLTGSINLPHDYIQYVRFERLILSGGFQNIGVGGTANHIKFTNLEVKNGTHQCVQIGQFTHDIWFTGGSVHDCGLAEPVENAGYPFYIGGNNHLIENMEVYSSNSFCFHIYSGTSTKPNRVTVRNTILHHCGLQRASSAAILLSGGDSHAAYNNILYSNACHGISAQSGATNAMIYNNTVYGGAQRGIQIQSTATSTDVRNNIAYKNATGEIADTGTGTILANNLTVDPRFRNPAAFDFNLQSSSSAIDAGATLKLVTTDIKKTSRPQGATYDIGAYEGDGTSVSLSPPRNLKVQ
jgi:parallel beta-helix repeat protein